MIHQVEGVCILLERLVAVGFPGLLHAQQYQKKHSRCSCCSWDDCTWPLLGCWFGWGFFMWIFLEFNFWNMNVFCSWSLGCTCFYHFRELICTLVRYRVPFLSVERLSLGMVYSLPVDLEAYDQFGHEWETVINGPFLPLTLSILLMYHSCRFAKVLGD